MSLVYDRILATRHIVKMKGDLRKIVFLLNEFDKTQSYLLKEIDKDPQLQNTVTKIEPHIKLATDTLEDISTLIDKLDTVIIHRNCL